MLMLGFAFALMDGSNEKKEFWLQLPQVLNDSPLRLQMMHCQPIIIPKQREVNRTSTPP